MMNGFGMSVLLTAVQTELTNTDKVRTLDEKNPTNIEMTHKEEMTKCNSNETIVNMTGFKQYDTLIGNQQIPVIKSTSKNDASSVINVEVETKKKPYGGRPLRFQCPDCERRFHAPSHLKRHMLCHSSERPFKCHICKKGFLQAWHLGRHMTTHTGNKPFNCPECPKSFGSRFEMKTHCNYIHRGIKEHKCPVCKKMFTLRSNLKVHMRKHTGEKPYECHICLKRFGQRGHLQYHVRKHTNPNDKESKERLDSLSDQHSPTMTNYRRSGEKEHSSNYDSGVEVESVSSDRNSPKRPIIDRFDESPQRSPREFGLEGYSPMEKYRRRFPDFTTTPLSGRMFDHTNPLELKPFVCDSCNCGFAEISSLRAHVRHSHPKKGITLGAYSCAYCGRTFEEIDCLREHFQYAHGSDKVLSPKPLLPTSLRAGEKHTTVSEEESYNPVKRARSAGIIRPVPMLSPAGRSTCSDVTYDRKPGRIPFRTESGESVISSCTCCPSPHDLLENKPRHAPETFYPDIVQERYLQYLEQYQRMLESQVDLIEALHAK